MADATTMPIERRGEGFLDRLNGPWHRPALIVFAVVILAHWAEHLVQAFQIWALGWKPPEARGVLGLAYPWLVTSEWLHFGYAVVMMTGIVLLARGFTGRARTWWTIAGVIQAWHLVEHTLLFAQSQAHHPLFGREQATSVVQLLAPRVELHLFYNAVVTIPMAVAMYYHLLAEPNEDACTCSLLGRAERRRQALPEGQAA
jgi:hypothetical protein